jgi:hypothetical protein
MSYSKLRGRIRRGLPVALAGLLAFTQTVTAQQTAVPAQAAPADPQSQTPAPAAPLQPLAPLPVEQSLKIRVLAGGNEQNDLGKHVMAPLVVQVVDRDERPIEGGEVVFRFPVSGPGAAFADGKTSQTARTNAEGQAAAVNWMANGQVGKFEVHVSASYSNQVGETTLSMINVTRIIEQTAKNKPASWWSHKWVKVAVIAGVAALVVGIVLATTGGSSSSGGSTSTVTIAPGSPSVGAP